MIKRYQHGFTLIELLVVIAIIGILASIVLASLNSARGKGGDAAIKGNLDTIQKQAEILYDDNSPNSYAGLCGVGSATVAADVTPATNALTSAANASGVSTTVTANAAGNTTTAVCHVGGTNNSQYLIAVPLKTDNTQASCVDNTGNSKTRSSTITAGTLSC